MFVNKASLQTTMAIMFLVGLKLSSDALTARNLFAVEFDSRSRGANESRREVKGRQMEKRANAPTFDPKNFLDYHNQIRRQERAANMIELRWDENLAKNAKRWIEKCIFDRPKSYVPKILRQNLHFTSGGLRYTDYISGAEDWFKEKKNYDFNTGHCGGFCAHYKTVVLGPYTDTALQYNYNGFMIKWDLTLMGCAVHDCPSLSAFGSTYYDSLYLSCEYYSPVKDWSRYPYKPGKSCSKCPEKFGTCNDRICTGPDSSYPPWNASEVTGKATYRLPSAISMASSILLTLTFLQ